MRVLIYECGDMFVAQALDADICTQAPDRETLRQRMDDTIMIERRCGGPLSEAPAKFHELWEAASPVAGGAHDYREARK